MGLSLIEGRERKMRKEMHMVSLKVAVRIERLSMYVYVLCCFMEYNTTL